MSPSKAKLLVIDDEQGIRELLKSEFSAQGYTVDVAGDGEEGIERLRQGKYDVVITDVKMPKRDGMQVLNAARAASPATEIIMITGYATVENAVEAMKQGAYDFVQKPFDIDELSVLVEKALEKRELKALVALYASSKAIFSTVKLEELFPVMIDLLGKAIPSSAIALLLLDFQDQFYLASASFPLVDHPDKDSFVSLAERLYSTDRTLAAPLIIAPSDENKRFLSGLFLQSGPRTLMAHPLRLKDRNLGMLMLARDGEGAAFSPTDLQNLSIFVSQIAQSIATSQLYEKLEIKMTELERMKQQLLAAQGGTTAHENKNKDRKDSLPGQCPGPQ